MVTHEPDIAGLCRPRSSASSTASSTSDERERKAALMLWETVTLAFRAIRRNALRSFLTMLGIVIGVAAVIAMVTLGSGATAKVGRRHRAASAATSSSSARARDPARAAPGRAPSRSMPTTRRRSRRQIAGVKAVAPSASQERSRRSSATVNWSTTLTGTDDGYFDDARQWDLAGGRTFTDSEIRAGSAVCIIGETVRKKLFGGGDPLGQIVRVQQDRRARSSACSRPRASRGFGEDQDDVVLMPLRAVQRRFAGNTRHRRSSTSSARDGVSTAKVQARHRGRCCASAAASPTARRTTSPSAT